MEIRQHLLQCYQWVKLYKYIIDLLFELNVEQGTTLIVATHDAKLSQLCEQRLRLDAGQLVTNDLTLGVADTAHE